MEIREIPAYKAVYFDMEIKKLEKHFSATYPKRAYRIIQRFLEANSFEHEQYSGYHSKDKMMDLQIVKLVADMQTLFPWIDKRMNKIEVANIGDNYNLIRVFEQTPLDLPTN